jgi:predicted ATPase/DNA-binding XRE family transcriptional regulator
MRQSCGLVRWRANLAPGEVKTRVRDLRAFRETVREHRRAVGRTQQQLARSIGLHPHVLSHKLNGRDNAVLTTADVIGIASTLAGWGALVTRADLYALLDLMSVPQHAVPVTAWSAPPLAALRDVPDEAAGPAAGLRAVTHTARRPAEPAGPRARVKAVPLPAPATPLTGRERERAEVAAALAASRLVTLTGVGGTGKTRLALQVARELTGDFADGVAFVDLAPVRDPALLAVAVARSLGLVPTSAEAAEAHLADVLRDLDLLLVVDNLEQLLDETMLLSRLLAGAQALRVLATSRIGLRLYGEHIVRVPPLGLPDAGGAGTPADSEAVQLFITRARAVRPDFAPAAEELVAIAEICAALDGLPLAIELAAARIRLYSPQALLPLLRSRLVLLTGGSRDLPHRQQTLRAALDWSHALLTPEERQLFPRLGVFAGPFDAAAAAAVSAEPAPARTLEQLGDLADQSLLEVIAGDNPHFRMLQTVREYALARLAETGEQDHVRRLHLACYLALAEATREDFNGPRQAELLDRLEAAYPNMRAALEFACQRGEGDSACLDQGLQLATTLGRLWQRRGAIAEGVLHLDRLLALDHARQHAGAPQIRAAAVLAACGLACYKGDYAKTAELARQGIQAYGLIGDHPGLSQVYRFLGEAELAVGDHAAAEPHFERQLAEACRSGDISGQADAYNMLSQVARYRGEFRRANALLWQAMKLFRTTADPGGIGVVLSSLAEVARDAGRPASARRLFRAAVRRHAALGDKRHLAFELDGLAAVAAMDGDGEQALVYLGAAQALHGETGEPRLPVEQAILDRILAPAVAPLSAQDRQAALARGRSQPLTAIIADALG